jgi:hypothetical protein
VKEGCGAGPARGNKEDELESRKGVITKAGEAKGEGEERAGRMEERGE